MIISPTIWSETLTLDIQLLKQIAEINFPAYFAAEGISTQSSYTFISRTWLNLTVFCFRRKSHRANFLHAYRGRPPWIGIENGWQKHLVEMDLWQKWPSGCNGFDVYHSGSCTTSDAVSLSSSTSAGYFTSACMSRTETSQLIWALKLERCLMLLSEMNSTPACTKFCLLCSKIYFPGFYYDSCCKWSPLASASIVSE